jgi:hypothetical protein
MAVTLNQDTGKILVEAPVSCKPAGKNESDVTLYKAKLV